MNTVLPKVTIIAPCRNEEKYIERAVISILNNDYPSELMDLLIVDGMSTDGTREIVKEMIKNDSRIKLLDNPHKIVPTAMNIGIKNAEGDYIIRIDCHSEFARDYIKCCIEVSQRTNAENVGGYCLTLPGSDTKKGKSIAAATGCVFGVGNSAFRLTGEQKEVDTVPFGCYPKKIFDEIGYYDERLVRNQDIELNSRIRKSGGKIVISPLIKLKYFNRSTYLGIWQQSFNNGLWNPYTIWLVGGGLNLRHFIPFFFVLSLLSFGTSILFYWLIVFLLLLEIVIYILLAIYFSFKCKKEKGVSAFYVFATFWVLHLAYGLGSLWGIITIPIIFPKRKPKTVGHILTDRKE